MSEGDASDDALMRAVVGGDHEAFRTLLQRHGGWVRSLLGAIVREHADDLAQEVFCRVYQRAADYTGRGQFAPWLKRIAVNLAKDFLRKQKGALTIGLEDIEGALTSDDQSNPVAALLSSALRQELRSAIRALPDKHRRVIVMRYFGGLSLQDIAGAMKCPLGTVKSRLFNGLRQIRRSLTREEN
jgi:RNA polymerase sigma-70 factor, ECF subfamily